MREVINKQAETNWLKPLASSLHAHHGAHECSGGQEKSQQCACKAFFGFQHRAVHVHTWPCYMHTAPWVPSNDNIAHLRLGQLECH